MLARHPDITYYTTNVGKGQPAIYYNVVPRNEQANFGQLFVQCRAETYAGKNALQRLDVLDRLSVGSAGGQSRCASWPSCA